VSLLTRIEKRTGGLGWLSSQPPVDWVRNAFLANDPIFSGKSVNEQTAMQVSAVYYCVGLITDAISSLPIEVFKEYPDGTTAFVRAPTWLRKPNYRMTPFDFWQRVFMSLLVAGNAYIYTLRNSAGDVVELWPIHPSWVYPFPKENSTDIVYSVNGVDMDQTEILHIPAMSMPGYLTGLSPLEAARQAIGIGMVTEEFGARFFSQGAYMSGIIQHPGKATKEEALRLKEDFVKKHQGVANSHAVGVLTGGASWHPITITPEQSQFLQTRNYTKADIALFYRVPAYRVDPAVTSSWGRGVEEQNYAMAQDTLHPWAARVEQAISTFLLPGFQQMRFNMDARLRAKLSERYQAHALAIQNGMKSPDEVRAEEGMAPIPNGDGNQWFRPANIIGIDEDLPTVADAKKIPDVVDGGELYSPPPAPDPTAPTEPTEPDADDENGGKKK
jgi:HK97 family phage portal protein